MVETLDYIYMSATVCIELQMESLVCIRVSGSIVFTVLVSVFTVVPSLGISLLDVVLSRILIRINVRKNILI